eukprot:3939913-Rhodomonas_salina.1
MSCFSSALRCECMAHNRVNSPKVLQGFEKVARLQHSNLFEAADAETCRNQDMFFRNVPPSPFTSTLSSAAISY